MYRHYRHRNTGSIARAVSAALFAASGIGASPVLFAQAEAPAEETQSKEPADDVTSLSDLEVNEDPLRAISNEPSASSFGFAKPLLETPRSVSFVSEEQIKLLGISTADDLTRVVPGVFTNRRWGMQGGVDVRGVSADMYFRGMKRLSMQGHARTSFTGMDAIEVVKGPPSPIYGMGRMGGYTNMYPKAGRAKTGAYLPSAQGFVQALAGAWDRSELSFGLGGPLSFGEKPGGYYVYGVYEDTPQTWMEQVHAKQKILQGATSIDGIFGPFRLETGGQYQNSNTAGAYLTRTSQALVDSGQYVRGVPLVDLDSNSDGKIGFLETHLNSPVLGNVTSTNRPLSQRFAWPTDPSTGQPVAFNGGFAGVSGIPQTMLDYLNDNQDTINCRAAQIMRQMPAGGPVPTSGQLPVGFVLNPCTVGYDQVNPRRGAYEKEQDAQLASAYVDLVYDTDPNFTIKNQLFFDRMETFKNSYLPYGERQSIWAIEDKLTATRRVPDEMLPAWLRVNALASVNHRITSAYAADGGGDYDYRNDIMAGDGTLSPNASFWNNLENESYETGAPKTSVQESKYSETGIGVMFDIDIFRKTNVVLGARFDWADAAGSDAARFSESCTSTAPCTSNSAFIGQWLPYERAEASDKGASWSVAVSHELPWGLRPYATFATASAVLDAANNILDRSTINAPSGFIGESELKEVGLKSSLFGGKLMFTTAAYEQSRTDLSNNADDPTAGADVTSTKAQGVEVELKWVPTKDIFVQIYGLFQEIEYIFASSANIEMTGSQLGFTDIVDPQTGEVLYPADAFIYGGRFTVSLPTSLRSQYMTRNGNPETQAGLNASWQVTSKVGVNVGANWFSETPVTRIQTITLPETTVANAGLTWTSGIWSVQLSGTNLTDERYYRSRNGDTRTLLLSSMPGRAWSLTVKHEFK